MQIPSPNNGLSSNVTRASTSQSVSSDFPNSVFTPRLVSSSSKSSDSTYTPPPAPSLRPSPSPTAMPPLLELSVMTTALPDPQSIITPRPVTFANLLEERSFNS